MVGSDSARFLKMTPSQTSEDVIYDVAALPELRLLMPEDRAWSRRWTWRVGRDTRANRAPSRQSRAGAVLHSAVDAALGAGEIATHGACPGRA